MISNPNFKSNLKDDQEQDLIRSFDNTDVSRQHSNLETSPNKQRKLISLASADHELGKYILS